MLHRYPFIPYLYPGIFIVLCTDFPIKLLDAPAWAINILSRVGLHIWSVTWPLASRGTHPVVTFYPHIEIEANVSTTNKYQSGGCGHFIMSTHRTRLSQV